MAIISKERLRQSVDWFKRAVRAVGHTIRNIITPELPFSESVTRLLPKHIGRMIMYYYDPKWKDALPYYDTFPLVILVNIKKDRFHGLNLHYLPIPLRMRFLQNLANIYNNQHMSENTRLQMSYTFLQGSRRLRYFEPCFKEYLYSHVRSKYNVVKPEEWEHVATLQLERFVKATNQRVWDDSRRKLGLR